MPYGVTLANSASTAQLEKLIQDLINTEATAAEHDMLVDATQLLSLGGITFEEVLGAAVYEAKQANDYSVGRTFDLFDTPSLAYGRHVAKVTGNLSSTTNVSQALVFPGKPRKARRQVQINSELKKDQNGRSYYEVLTRSHYVTANVYTPWSMFNIKNGARRIHKLYVVGDQKFQLKGESVALGSTSVYDQVMNDIYATGVVGRYEAIMRDSFTQDEIDIISEEQQVLFLSVFKVLKPEIDFSEEVSA